MPVFSDDLHPGGSQGLILRQCQRGSADDLSDGLVHEKTVPAVIVAQCRRGMYEAWCDGGHARIPPGHWLVVGCMHTVRIAHHHDSRGRMAARWFHLRVDHCGGLDCFAGWSLPLHLDTAAGRPIAAAWDLLESLPADASPTRRAIAVSKAAYTVCETLVSCAMPIAENPMAGLARFAELGAWLDRHLHKPLGVEVLAAQAHLSPAQFHAVFKKATAMTPMAWVQRLRLERAARELLAVDDSIQRIAERCGFVNPFHFSRAFKQWAGSSPRAWRQAHGDQRV